MIPFNNPPNTGNEAKYVLDAMQSNKISGDGPYGKKCQAWFQSKLSCQSNLLTPSCTHALEMAALLIDIQPGDEVILPSYTFVSTANAFVLRGAKVVFVDIRHDTMNIDEQLIPAAITPNTKAIVVVHYAGVSCEMDTIMSIASEHNLYVIEDAAQGMMSEYKGRPLGSIGHLGAYSFHETKNYTSGGEGGLLIVNAKEFSERAEIIREKGTNRSQFFRGQTDKYTWVDIGSSYLPSELQAAYLWGQLEQADVINDFRLKVWDTYYKALLPLQETECIKLPIIPDTCTHNAHMFYIKVANLDVRQNLISYLRENKVTAVFHYVPLHSSTVGLKFGRFHGKDQFTTSESDKLLRLPMYYDINSADQSAIIDFIYKFYEGCQ